VLGLCTGQADTEGAGLASPKNYVGQGYKVAGFDLSNNILNAESVLDLTEQHYRQTGTVLITITTSLS